MARSHFVKKSNKNIYVTGKFVKYISKRGKVAGQEKGKLDRTVPANKDDKILIAKGEPYYWWKFRHGGIHISKEAPKPSQLTQSSYLSTLYEIQERIENINVDSADEFESEVEEIKSDLESLKDECQSSLDNMPESLQENSSSGQLLTERIEALDNAISEIDGIDLGYDEPSKDDLSLEEDATDEEVEEMKVEKFQEWLIEKKDELSNVSFE